MMSLELFKSQVIFLIQELFKLSKTDQEDALNFLKSNIENLTLYNGSHKCVRETDSSSNTLKSEINYEENNGNITHGHEVLRKFEVIEENITDEEHNDVYDDTQNLSSDKSDQSSSSTTEVLESNDTNKNETIADNNSITSVSVKSSRKKVNGKSLVNCAICKETFKALPALLHHLMEHDGTQISCISCKRVFNNYVAFNLHKSVCHTFRNMKVVKGLSFIFDRKHIAHLQLSKVLCCPFCGENFSSGFNLRRHIETKKCRNSDSKTSDNVVQCKYCNTIFKSQEEHDEHIAKKHVRLCDLCGPLVMSVRDWKSHKKRHEQLLQIERKYNCKMCSQYFSTRQLLREHSRQHRNDPNINKQPEDSDKRYTCNECSYNSSYLSNLRRHINLKHKLYSIDKKFSCHKCPMMFNLHNALKEHLTSIHSTERSLVCPLCTASFKLPSSLSRHMAGHSQARLECACCHQRFHRYDGLKRHLRKHRTKPEQTQTLKLLPQEITVIPPPPLELAAQECSDLMLPGTARTELIISTPARSELNTSTPVRSELVSLMDLQSGEMLTLSPADYMLYLSS